MWKSPTLLSHSGEGEEYFALLVAYILFKALRGLGVVSETDRNCSVNLFIKCTSVLQVLLLFSKGNQSLLFYIGTNV